MSDIKIPAATLLSCVLMSLPSEAPSEGISALPPALRQKPVSCFPALVLPAPPADL